MAQAAYGSEEGARRTSLKSPQHQCKSNSPFRPHGYRYELRRHRSGKHCQPLLSFEQHRLKPQKPNLAADHSPTFNVDEIAEPVRAAEDVAERKGLNWTTSFAGGMP